MRTVFHEPGRKTVKRFLLIVVSACLFAGAAVATANQMTPPSDLGTTARAMALGNAMTGVDGDPSSSFHNPAALALYDTSLMNFTYLWTGPNLEGGPKGRPHDVDEGNNIVFSNLVIDLSPIFRNRRPLAFGFTMNFDRNGLGFINFVDIKEPEGYFYRYGRTSTMATTTLGVGITDWLYFGFGTLITLRGTTDFYVSTDLGGNTEDEGMVLDARLAHSAILSTFVDLEKVDLGLTYRQENYGKFGDIIVDAEATVGNSRLTELPMVLAFQDTYVPQSVAVGCSLRPTEDVMVAVDGTWHNWGAFDEQITRDDLPRKRAAVDFVDIYVPRAGVEYNVVESLAVRLGYQFQPTPMRSPGSDGNIFLDNNRHVGSIGLGYTALNPPALALPVSFDLTYFHQYLVPDEYESGEGEVFESKGNVNGASGSLTLRF